MTEIFKNAMKLLAIPEFPEILKKVKKKELKIVKQGEKIKRDYYPIYWSGVSIVE